MGFSSERSNQLARSTKPQPGRSHLPVGISSASVSSKSHADASGVSRSRPPSGATQSGAFGRSMHSRQPVTPSEPPDTPESENTRLESSSEPSIASPSRSNSER